MKAERPTHLVEVGANRTLCGIKRMDKAAFPQVDPRFVERNVRAHGHPVCAACESALPDRATRSQESGP